MPDPSPQPAVSPATAVFQVYSEQHPQPGQPQPSQPQPSQPQPSQPQPSQPQPSQPQPSQPQARYAASPWASQVVGAAKPRLPAVQGYQPAPQPVAPIRARWIVLSVVAGVALLGLVATLGVVAAVRQSTGPQVGAASAHKGDLSGLMVPAPAGSRPWATGPQDEGLDLDAASQLPGENALGNRRTMLKRWSFVRGYVRRWTSDKVAVQVVLYQFADETSAAGFALDDLTGDARSGYTASVPIDGTDNGVSMVLARPSSAGDSGTLGVARVGDIVVAVLTVEAPPPDVVSGNQVVVAQLHRL